MRVGGTWPGATTRPKAKMDGAGERQKRHEMLSFLLLSTLLLRSTLAGITDLNCTESVGEAVKYAQTAVNCQNKLSDASCTVLYTTAVKANTDTDRDAKCAGNPVDPHLVQAAIQLCPQTCGYCCLTPAYACDNKPQPRIPCSSVTTEMCQNIAWKSILEEDCPKTCGLCDSG
ncbi:Metridin ShK toxin domain containing protein [Trichostrongylus colubriformis]|uniref:Metridin ShK toxin domain containing protein n=1 Tax=Trichostrongylus colubriformis TaxID=6319 RepID=A0AAN8G5P7_TRICO